MNNIANATEAVPHFAQRRCLHIVFASTSGHTEYVVNALIDSLKSITPGWEIKETVAEKTQPQDLLSGDVLLLASATWNTGSIEGQLNPHMWVLLHDKAKTLDLAGKPCACIGLGDHRYFYTARAADHPGHGHERTNQRFESAVRIDVGPNQPDAARVSGRLATLRRRPRS